MISRGRPPAVRGLPSRQRAVLDRQRHQTACDDQGRAHYHRAQVLCGSAKRKRVSLCGDCQEEVSSKPGEGECMTLKQCSVSSSGIFSNSDDPAAPYKALVQERFFDLLSLRLAAS